MIGEPPLLRIQRHFKRPSAEQIAAFTGLQTGFVVDAMNGRGALDGRIKSFGAVHSFCGAALPCYTGPNDNLAAFGALSVAMPGDVILRDRCGGSSGEIDASGAKATILIPV